MIRHQDLGNGHFTRLRLLKMMINTGDIALGGNSKLKIYGYLDCKSGKRMKVANRVFFTSATEATAMGYRPCGRCLIKQYRAWKLQQQ